MSNRITNTAAKFQAALDEKNVEELNRLDKTMDLVFLESVKYRDLNALACFKGKLTTEEGMVVYNALGREGMPKGGWTRGTTLAMKITVTSLMAQLIGLVNETEELD